MVSFNLLSQQKDDFDIDRDTWTLQAVLLLFVFSLFHPYRMFFCPLLLYSHHTAHRRWPHIKIECLLFVTYYLPVSGGMSQFTSSHMFTAQGY